MAATEPLKKLNEVLAKLMKQSTFQAALGSIDDGSLWANTVADIKNGNAMLIIPGPGSAQISIEPSAMIIDRGGFGLAQVKIALSTPIVSVLTPPIGARTDGPNFFFSEFTSFAETVVLLAGKFNHIYSVFDSARPNNMAIACIVSDSATAPITGLLTNIGVEVSPRQAVCFVEAAGKVTLLQTFPALFNQTAAQAEDAPASFADWQRALTSVDTNVIKVSFTFLAGTGTGAIGEVAIKIGTDVVGYLPISPQLLKDEDIDMTVNWTIMLGEPGAFI